MDRTTVRQFDAPKTSPVSQPGELDELIASADVHTGLPVCLKSRIEELKAKYEVYQEKELNYPKILLECYGYVSAIRGNEVEAVLSIDKEDGSAVDSRRVFSGDRFKAAKLYFEDAAFRYVIVRKGADVTSRIESAAVSEIDSQLDSDRQDLDLAVFDLFQLKR